MLSKLSRKSVSVAQEMLMLHKTLDSSSVIINLIFTLDTFVCVCLCVYVLVCVYASVCVFVWVCV